MEATWPPARRWQDGGWTLRDGAGGGKRVSAATTDGVPQGPLPPLVMVRQGQDALDASLAGYAVVDPSVLYTVPVAGLVGAGDAEWPPSDRSLSLWAASGTGPARIAVMERVAGPKAVLTAPDGVAFVAADGDIAMIHAVEVAAHARRRGTGRRLLCAAAAWAQAQGADTLALAVTARNAAARALYANAGMVQATTYHYRERS